MRTNLTETTVGNSHANDQANQISNQELCQELAERFEELVKLHSSNRDSRRFSSVSFAALNAFTFTISAATAAATAGASAPVSAPLMAFSGALTARYTREALRPELAAKRLAYEHLTDSLGFKTGISEIIPYSKVSKNLNAVRTCVKIGKGKLDISALEKIDPALIDKCKSGLVSLRKEDEENSRAQERNDRFNPLHQTTINTPPRSASAAVDDDSRNQETPSAASTYSAAVPLDGDNKEKSKER